MTDADLIYNALLRAERRAEMAADAAAGSNDPRSVVFKAGLLAVRMIREEVGNGLAARPMKVVPHATPAGLDAISGKGG